MSTKKTKAENKISPKELSEVTALVKAIAAKKQVGAVIVVKPIKEGKKTGQGVHILSHNFSHDDMHKLINNMIGMVHPEIAVLSDLFGGLVQAAAASEKKGKGKK